MKKSPEKFYQQHKEDADIVKEREEEYQKQLEKTRRAKEDLTHSKHIYDKDLKEAREAGDIIKHPELWDKAYEEYITEKEPIDDRVSRVLKKYDIKARDGKVELSPELYNLILVKVLMPNGRLKVNINGIEIECDDFNIVLPQISERNPMFRFAMQRVHIHPRDWSGLYNALKTIIKMAKKGQSAQAIAAEVKTYHDRHSDTYIYDHGKTVLTIGALQKAVKKDIESLSL